MKFILNKDKLTIDAKENEILNSGSVKYYEVEVEFDESWEGLSIEARIANREGCQYADEGNAIAVINNKMFIDKELSGSFGIGFIGYEVENETKTYQISTNLAPIFFNKGAGEITVTNSEDVPEITEWETYLAQVQEFMNNANTKINEANNLDLDISKQGRIATVTITKKDGTTKSENVEDGVGLDYNWQGTSLGIKKETEQQYEYVDLIGDCNFATFEINNNMELVMNKTEDMLLDFAIDENSMLYVII